MDRVIYLLPPMSWREVFTVIMCVWLSTMVYGDNVCLVVNYGIPVDRDGQPDFETYLHKVGNTGRFGRKRTAISLITDQNP